MVFGYRLFNINHKYDRWVVFGLRFIDFSTFFIILGITLFVQTGFSVIGVLVGGQRVYNQVNLDFNKDGKSIRLACTIGNKVCEKELSIVRMIPSMVFI